MADVYDSPIWELHPSGWFQLAGGTWITKLPVWEGEASGLFCHWGAAEGAARLAGAGMRLPTWQELEELHHHALFLDPVTLPTAEMQKQGAVPGDPAMSSRAWCAIHDAEVFARLAKAGWDGAAPVSNAGKHWCADGAIYGWWKRGGGMIQGLSYFHEPGQKAHVPPLGQQRDYASTCHAVVSKSSPPATPSSGGSLYPDGAPTGQQMRRRGAVVGALFATMFGGALAYLL